jgi:two-component system nitrogen regulation sensor histidine kinase NtrY
VLSTTTYPLTNNLGLIFKDKIHELAQIHNLEINIYSLNGKLLKSSKASFSIDSVLATHSKIHSQTGSIFYRKKIRRY